MNAPVKLNPHAPVSYEELREALKGAGDTELSSDILSNSLAHAVHLDWFGPYQTRESASQGATDIGITKGFFIIASQDSIGNANATKYIGCSSDTLPWNVRYEDIGFEVSEEDRIWIGYRKENDQSSNSEGLSSDLIAIRWILKRCFQKKGRSKHTDSFPDDRVVIRNHWHDLDKKPSTPKGRVFADLIVYVNDNEKRLFAAYLKNQFDHTLLKKKDEGVTYLYANPPRRDPPPPPKKNTYDRITSTLAAWMLSGVIGAFLFAVYGAHPTPIDGALLTKTKTVLESAQGLQQLYLGATPVAPPSDNALGNLKETEKLLNELQNKEIKNLLAGRTIHQMSADIVTRDAKARLDQRHIIELTSQGIEKDAAIKDLKIQLANCGEHLPFGPSISYSSDYVCYLTDKTALNK